MGVGDDEIIAHREARARGHGLLDQDHGLQDLGRRRRERRRRGDLGRPGLGGSRPRDHDLRPGTAPNGPPRKGRTAQGTQAGWRALPDGRGYAGLRGGRVRREHRRLHCHGGRLRGNRRRTPPSPIRLAAFPARTDRTAGGPGRVLCNWRCFGAPGWAPGAAAGSLDGTMAWARSESVFAGGGLFPDLMSTRRLVPSNKTMPPAIAPVRIDLRLEAGAAAAGRAGGFDAHCTAWLSEGRHPGLTGTVGLTLPLCAGVGESGDAGTW